MFLAVAFTLLLSISFLYFSPDGIILVSTASNQVEVELKDEGDEVSTTIEAHDQSVPMLIPIRTLPMAWHLFTHSDMNEDVEPTSPVPLGPDGRSWGTADHPMAMMTSSETMERLRLRERYTTSSCWKNCSIGVSLSGVPGGDRLCADDDAPTSSLLTCENVLYTHARTMSPRAPWPRQSALEDPTSAYVRSYLQTPGARPNAPIPPTPHSQTAAPSPSPLISAMQSEVEHRQIGSPYPYPFTHIRRTTVAAPPVAPSSSYDMNNPAVIREQLALQMQIYALNNGLAPPSDSTFSPPSTPFPGPAYYPWTFVPLRGVQDSTGGTQTAMSIRSSPSHEPVQLPPPPPMRGKRREPAPQAGLRAARRMKPPPRVESTQPRETSPEPSSGSGEETAGEERFVDRYIQDGSAEAGEWGGTGNGSGTSGTAVSSEQVEEDDGEWVDEEEEGEEEDLLQLEYHPSYVSNPQKRRRRWENRWDALMQAFQAVDRETDATLVLLAAPSHSTKLHALTSRSIRRDPALANSPKLSAIKSSFNSLATQRRTTRAHRVSLVQRLQLSSASSAAGSPGGEAREEDLRRALEAALGSLGEMGKIYEQREVRWRDEMRQLTEDRDRVEMLLRQTLGPVLHENGHGRS
ncbi:predicted protein [Postia placenta Mad-698-R]|nr:predicted protein [Postia placenta Mad-698-R]